MMSSNQPAPQTISVNVSYDPFTLRLFSELETHLASLRNVLSSINKKAYGEVAAQSVNGGFLGLSMAEDSIDEVGLAQAEIRKTFMNLMRSLIDFIDSVLGINSIVNTPQELPNETITAQELQKYMDELINKRIQKIAKDVALSNVKKLGMLPSLSPNYDAAIKGYFALRRSIEHHKSIAQSDTNLSLQRQTIVASDGTEIKQTPIVLKGPSTISLHTVWDTKKFKKGDPITLTELDLEHLYMTIRLYIAPELIKKLITPAEGAKK